MNFTREPIIETIITPKEGYKLLIKNSKGVVDEEYSVDAVEVVSFGAAIFYRSTERPKPFLVPVGDFEVIETKEAKVALKSVHLERSIKIGGGRDAKPSHPARESVEKVAEISPEGSSGSVPEKKPEEQRHEKKRDRRHRRRRRSQEENTAPREEPKPQEGENPVAVNMDAVTTGTEDVAPPFIAPMLTTLFPPPPTLISEKLGRLREQQAAELSALPPSLSPLPEEIKDEVEKKEEIRGNSDTEINDLYRISSLPSHPDNYSRFSSTTTPDYFLKT